MDLFCVVGLFYFLHKMFHVFKNIFVVFVVILVVVNVSLLNTPLVDHAIQNLLLFTAWAFTMRYLVDPERVSWILILYSSCILALLMFHTLVSWASLHSPHSFWSMIVNDVDFVSNAYKQLRIENAQSLTPCSLITADEVATPRLAEASPLGVLNVQRCKLQEWTDWTHGGLKNALLWFDTLAFFFMVYLVERREDDVDIERVRA